MSRYLCHRPRLPALLAATAVLAVSVVNAEDVSRIVAIGDSWTNDCCSNGPTWVQLAAAELQVPLDNRARNGASSDDLLNQVRQYLQQGIDRDALHVYWNVGNDFTSDGGLDDVEATVAAIEANMTTALTLLEQAGARHVLVFNNVDGDLVPRAISSGMQQLGRHISDLQNASVAAVLADLQLTESLFDARALFGEIVADPRFTNVSQGCLNVSCSNPDQFVWWDGNHPTAATHRIIAARVVDRVTEGALVKPLPPTDVTVK